MPASVTVSPSCPPRVGPGAAGVYLTHDQYAELRRAGEAYAEMLSGMRRSPRGAAPPQVGVMTEAHLRKVSLVELREDVTLRQSRPGISKAEQPQRLRQHAADTFSSVLHVERKRLIVFKQGGGASRLVAQMPLTDARGQAIRVRVCPSEDGFTGVVLVEVAAGRVVEIGFADAVAADTFATVVKLRASAAAADQREESPRSPASTRARKRSPAARTPRVRSRIRDISPPRPLPSRPAEAPDEATPARAFPPAASMQPPRPSDWHTPPGAPPPPPPPTLAHQRRASPPRRHAPLQILVEQPPAPRGPPPAIAAAAARRRTSPPLRASRTSPPLRASRTHSPAAQLPDRAPPVPPANPPASRSLMPPEMQAELPREAFGERYHATSPLDGIVELCDREALTYCDGFDESDADLAAAAPSGRVVWRRITDVVPRTPLLPPETVQGAPAGDEIDWGPAELGHWLVGVLAVALQELSAQGRDAQRERRPARDMHGARFLMRPHSVTPTGAYQVQFFLGDAWVYVVVDDRVPCDHSSGRSLLPTLPGPMGGLYLTLVLKAVAKLCGGWSLFTPDAPLRRPPPPLPSGCGTAVAGLLAVLTGGSTLLPVLPHPRSDDFRPPWGPDSSQEQRAESLDAFCDATWRCIDNLLSPVGAEVLVVAAADRKLLSGRGLQPGGMYRVLEVVTAEAPGAPGETLRLLRLHSPYCETAWTGAWGPDAREWRTVPRLAAALEPRTELDGSFWIEFVDFLNHVELTAAVRMFTGWNELSVRGVLNTSTLADGGCDHWYQMELYEPGQVFIAVQAGADGEQPPSFAVRAVVDGDVDAGGALSPAARDPCLVQHFGPGVPVWGMGDLPAGRYGLQLLQRRGTAAGTPYVLRVFAHQSFVLVRQPSAPMTDEV
eukprot:TRINITY_DN4841_c0_g1_i3.p1 TRINITY_DN4841_c0_g1~~TRINITY_DN4841_c0_g1_i3.p1  ORF type:complete len:910 (+),score=218.93 TRINITY_DN4841_c0_g1_i3:49-2730(+)